MTIILNTSAPTAEIRKTRFTKRRKDLLQTHRIVNNNLNSLLDYIKEYNFSFPTNSQRLKEKKQKMLEKSEKTPSIPSVSDRKVRKKSSTLSNNYNDCYEYIQFKRKKSTTDKRAANLTNVNKSLNFLSKFPYLFF